MADQPKTLEDYIKRLAEGLEALGPAESGEVVAEIRAHLTDALSDAGGDENTVLAQFGNPDVLVARILEERGVLSAGSSVPEASASARLLALGVDVTLGLVACIFLYAFLMMPVASYRFGGTPSAPAVVAIWAILVLGAIASTWWWIRRLGQPGRSTTGMRLLGLRRIRMAQTTRVVRERDIPGTPRKGRLLPVVRTALAILILASFIYSMTRTDTALIESQIENAVTNSSTGVAVVSDVYRQVVAGGRLDALSGTYAPSARKTMVELVRRRAMGTVETYSIASTGLPDYLARAGSTRPVDDIVVLVTVNEFSKGSDIPRPYRYRVVCAMKQLGGGLSGGDWLIQSVDPVAE